MKNVFMLMGLLVLVGGATVVYWQRSTESSTAFRTAPVTRGDLLVTISATGTVEPEEVVDVGTQVAGQIEAFGQDLGGSGETIDYGSAVDEGTLVGDLATGAGCASVHLIG